jgi:hypothetical protein
MAFSYHNYQPTNNTTDTFNIPFTFTAQSEISVTVNGVAQSNLTFPSSSTVKLASPVATNSLVQVRRTTSLTSRAIDFTSGSVLTEEDLDNSNIQVFHAAQESADLAGDSVQLGNDSKWDAGGNVIKNVGTPTANTDAATKAYTDTEVAGVVTTAVAQATTAAQNTVNTATGNLIPDATKLAIHPVNSQYTLSDGSTTDYSAKHYQSVASAAAVAAASSETDAQASEDEAEAWAQKVNGEAVTGEGYSSKAWAIGGTGVSNASGGGNAKDWATETASTADATEYSAKEYAIGAQRRGQASGGSAKDWATYTGGTVDNAGYSAKYWAEAAQASVATFDNKYFGALSSDPSQDPDGSALEAGDIYYSSSAGNMRVYNGSQWEDVAVSASSFASAGFSIAMAIAL